MMRVALIGVGHQGKNHVRFLKSLSGAKLTLIVDIDSQRASQAGEEYQVPFDTHYKNHLNEFDAAIIASPTSTHFSIASELAGAGKHLLIEKPVAASVEEAEKLAVIVEKSGVIVRVGFPERYNPSVQRALPSITRPLFIECHRLGLFSPRSLDVDVVLDLMIHDLDLLHLFLGEEASELEAVGIPILSRNVDIANARIKFPGKCVANITASRVSAKRMRKMRLFQPYYYLSMDFVEQSVSLTSLQPDACQGGMPQINHMQYKPEQPVHPLELEQLDFCNAIAGTSDQGVTITAAIPSLRMALNVKSKFSLPEI
jgi:predicted dehydrogenase